MTPKPRYASFLFMDRWHDNWMNSQPNMGVTYVNPEPLGMSRIGFRGIQSGRRKGDVWKMDINGKRTKFNAFTFKYER